MLSSVFADADVISTYTIENAIEDGVLVDLRVQTPDVTAQHFGQDAVRRPVVCTQGVWHLIQKAIAHPRALNDLNGVVHDIMWMSRMAAASIIRCGETRALPFKVIVTGTGRVRNHTIMVHVVMEEHAGRAIPGAVTFHLPDED